MQPIFSSAANWIWLAKKDRDKNSYVLFRRSIDLRSIPKSATLAITADSRYELCINDTFVGHGPVRSWPSPWPVDTYDIRHLLVTGKNNVEILVTHFGISTFQYLHDQPGLIAELHLDDKTIVTDSTWQAAPHTSYLWPAPRITCQQAWEEQFDARQYPKDSDFAPAKILRRAGEAPHEQFEPRDIPMLTLDPIEPLSIRSIEAVRPCNYIFALNPREFVTADDKSANHILARMLLMTTIDSPREQKLDLHQPHTRPFLPWKLNGEALNFDDKSLQKTDTAVAHATLKKGINTLMTRLPESEHHFWANLNLWTEAPVQFSPWLAAGPFAGGRQTHVFDKVVVLPDKIEPSATAELFDSIFKAGYLDDTQKSAPYVRPLTSDMIATTDAYATCASDRPDPTITPRVENPGAMLHDNADWTTIHPAKPGPSGPGIRILFDYGRESIGFQEFELDAPAGAIVDVCNFEFIQRDGRFNLNESMNNSSRYICREGIQKYKTFLRRGLKYSWLVLRNFDKPVRIRLVRALMSTYPQTNIGSFECSDAKLTQIWRTGVRSVECCSEDTYTDCPTYEQTFWVGDARNEALVDLISNGDARLSGRCLRLTGRSLDRSSITESQVPSGWQNLLPTWTALWMRWTQEHYQLTGDKPFAKEMLAFLDRNFTGIQKEINADGLFNMFGWNLFDWAAMDTPGNAIVTHINCLLSQALMQTAELAKSLGDQQRADQWESAARGLALAVNKHLWSEEKRAYLDSIHKDGNPSTVFSQQTQTAAYISGVATGDRAARCRDIVHNPPDDFIKAGSPFFMFFLLEALVRENRFDALIDTIRNYWGKQTDAGATTFWEMYHEPDDPSPFTNENRLTRSHCHGWSAAPTFFLTQYVLGIRPHEPGYATVLVAPHPGSLTFAQGRVPTPHGAVDCYWTSSEKRFDLSIEVPSGIPTRIELPLKGKVTIVEGTADINDKIVTSKSPRIKVTVIA